MNPEIIENIEISNSKSSENKLKDNNKSPTKYNDSTSISNFSLSDNKHIQEDENKDNIIDDCGMKSKDFSHINSYSSLNNDNTSIYYKHIQEARNNNQNNYENDNNDYPMDKILSDTAIPTKNKNNTTNIMCNIDDIKNKSNNTIINNRIYINHINTNNYYTNNNINDDIITPNNLEYNKIISKGNKEELTVKQDSLSNSNDKNFPILEDDYSEYSNINKNNDVIPNSRNPLNSNYQHYNSLNDSQKKLYDLFLKLKLINGLYKSNNNNNNNDRRDEASNLKNNNDSSNHHNDLDLLKLNLYSLILYSNNYNKYLNNRHAVFNTNNIINTTTFNEEKENINMPESYNSDKIYLSENEFYSSFNLSHKYLFETIKEENMLAFVEIIIESCLGFSGCSISNKIVDKNITSFYYNNSNSDSNNKDNIGVNTNNKVIYNAFNSIIVKFACHALENITQYLLYEELKIIYWIIELILVSNYKYI